VPSAESLTFIQKESWLWFLEKGFSEAVKSIFPVSDYTGNNWILDFGKISFGSSVITPERAKLKGLNYTIPVRVKAILTNKRTGEKSEEEIFLLNLPAMTDEGTFIVNGIERAISNQLVRSPGVYFTKETDPATGKNLYLAEIRPVHGSWLEFFVSRRGVIFARIDRRRKFPATILLRAVGFDSDKILRKEFSSFIDPTLELDSSRTKEEAILEFYRKLRPGEPAVLDTATNFLRDRFFNSRFYEIGQVGRYKMNKRLGLSFSDEDKENWVLTKEDLRVVVKYLVALQKDGVGKLDDIDHLGNRRLRRVGEILSQVVLRPAVARFERMIKERMSLISPKEKALPSQTINPQAIINAMNSFFRTNQLSAILDQTNPLSETDLLRRITVVGPGGLSRERASFSIRDIHYSQYGRICPVRSPEGQNVGLVTFLALFAKVNKYGFLEAPYRIVEEIKVGGRRKMKVTERVIYLAADDEEEYYITHAGVKIDEKGIITEEWVAARYKGEFMEVPAEKIQLIDFTSKQILGVSASLIPFIAHDHAGRAMMGAHMQCQAAPLAKPEEPIVGTGMEEAIAQGMHRIIKAEDVGKITYVDGEKISVSYGKNKEKNYKLAKFFRTNPYGTCYNQRPVVKVGDKIKKGDLLADGPATDNGRLSLGRNLVIAYCQLSGLGYEDALVISDRLVKEDVFTSVQINEYEAQVVDTKLGPEEITRDIPNVAEEDLAKLTQEGIVMIGAEVGPNDILIGKVEPKGEKELSAEERLLRAIFGDKAREVKDTSLRVPHGEGGVVISIDILDRDEGDELGPGINKIVKIKVAQLRLVREGDKLAGRHGNKGVISRIMPAADMPYLEDGTPVDIVLSPLSVVARMNLGQILESLLGWAGLKLNEKYVVPSFEKLSEEEIEKKLTEAGLPVSGKVKLFDGRDGFAFEQPVAVGVAYFMKLIHMVEDKVHARSIGPYSLVTQQPLGGKARMGGQRLGEMEVWALEAHRAAYVLQEMLTIKADDITGRAQAFQAIIKGLDIPPPTIVPESFKVLVKELAGLGLKVFPVGAVFKEKTFVKSENENNPENIKENKEIAVDEAEIKEVEQTIIKEE